MGAQLLDEEPKEVSHHSPGLGASVSAILWSYHHGMCVDVSAYFKETVRMCPLVTTTRGQQRVNTRANATTTATTTLNTVRSTFHRYVCCLN